MKRQREKDTDPEFWYIDIYRNTLDEFTDLCEFADHFEYEKKLIHDRYWRFIFRRQEDAEEFNLYYTLKWR